ncbi:MAG: hypothetical protein EOO03_14555, partial [Chitinophagaceae bacterium]
MIARKYSPGKYPFSAILTYYTIPNFVLPNIFCFMILKRILCLSVLWVMAACSTVPVTGRRQLKLVPSSELQSMSYTSYQQVLGESKVVSGTAEANMVKSVGGKIQRAVEQFMAKEGQADKLEGYAWEFNLIQSPEVNAWCMPGGK